MSDTGKVDVGPITSGERILYIDVLRGMALFGILAANMRAFSAPPSLYGNIRPLFHSMPDLIAQGFIDIFIQGKFITLFSFLFGLGFAVQLSRAEARGAKFMSFYPRRLLALAGFGLIHGLLIWWGDILLTYAFAGGLLLFFRKRGGKTLLWWAGSIFVTPILVTAGLNIAGLLHHGPFAQPYHPFHLSRVTATLWVYAHGSPLEILKQNWILWLQDTLPSQSFAIYALSLFLAGMWVYRSGIVEHLDQYRPLLKRLCAICIPAGIAANAIVVWAQLQTPTGHPTIAEFIGNAFDLPSAHLLSLGYASGLALLFLKDSWRRRLSGFAAIGRMALTNYLMESILCTLFYSSYTTGTYGHVGPAVGLIPTVI
ncbi:MAG TPA: DUF418 domain-containing protein, partial [Bryobacteraceae bacterium]|nr:DUF418 domain-containing protein [Bryobacteraceae bacterium]